MTARGYQRWVAGCIRLGETDCGGLDMLRPVIGLTMGMALRVRVAAGWWSFNGVETAAGTKGVELELSEKLDSGATVCDWGEAWGEPLDNDERSEDAEWTETMSPSVSRVGQNSRSSSRSKERCSSKRWRKLVTAAASSSRRAARTGRCPWFWAYRGARFPLPE